MNVLLIKLGALGDVVLAFQPMADIRAHHPDARLAVLTTAPFAPLLARAPWFDEVLVDARPKPWDLRGLARLRRLLCRFDLIYDLQTSGRSSRYRLLARRGAGWSGIGRGASLPHANPDRDRMHTIERQREQLAMAGVPPAAPADLGWVRAAAPAVGAPYALLVPGAAAHRPGKRWPVAGYAALAVGLERAGLRPVVVGSAAEAPLGAAIGAACPAALDLTGRTDLAGLAGLAAGAAVAVGNDTGPMHLAASLGVPSLVLFGPESDPALTAPRGPRTRVLSVPDLSALSAERVAAALATLHTASLPEENP